MGGRNGSFECLYLVDEPIGAGFFEFGVGSITPGDGECFDAVFVSAQNVVFAVANHQAMFGSSADEGQSIGQEFVLFASGPVEFRAEYLLKMVSEPKVFEDLVGVDVRFRGRDQESVPGILQGREHLGNAVIDAVFEHADDFESFAVFDHRVLGHSAIRCLEEGEETF